MSTSLTSFHRTLTNDLFDKALDFATYLADMKANRTFGYRLVSHGSSDGFIDIETDDGERRRVVNGLSNDYLALSNDARVKAAVTAAIDTYGVGATGAAMLNGNSPEHVEFEHELADFLGKEAVMLAPSGYAAMQSTCVALLTPRDIVFADQACHDSINTGLRLSGAEVIRFRHRDLDQLASLLDDRRGDGRGALIVSDGVFSVDGAVADVDGLVDLAQRFDCRLFIDDAHGIGVLGDGPGVGARDGVDLLGGTLSKAFGSHGGFLAGSAEVIEHARVFGGASCSTTNLSVANVAAARAALRIARDEPERRSHAVAAGAELRSRLVDAGIDLVSTPMPIIGLVCGSDEAAQRTWRVLFDAGVAGHPLPFPIAPYRRATLRLRLSATTGSDALDVLSDVLIDHFGRRRSSVSNRTHPRRQANGADSTDSHHITSTPEDIHVHSS